MTDPSRCKVCKEPERARLIEADWAGGMSAVGIAARLKDAGWPIAASAVLRHLHHVPGAHNRTNTPIPVGMTKRDAALFVRDRIMDELEVMEDDVDPAGESKLNILSKDLQPALGSMLRAQDIIDKRETREKNKKISLFVLMLGGPDGKNALAPLELSSGEDVIEGEFDVVG
jgi:hypothetical protein